MNRLAFLNLDGSIWFVHESACQSSWFLRVNKEVGHGIDGWNGIGQWSHGPTLKIGFLILMIE